MIHRAILCFTVSMIVVACASKTASLGGPQGNQTSASSKDGDGGHDSGTVAIAASDDDAAASQNCSWYAWRPVPTEVPCEYLLPSPPYSDPGYDPKTWDPHNVRIVFGAKQLGLYTETSAGCSGTDGWYYVDADGEAPTRFMICPNACATVASDGLDGGDGYLGLTAQSCH